MTFESSKVITFESNGSTFLPNKWEKFKLSSRISNPASQIPVMMPTAAKPTIHGKAREECPRTSHLFEHRAPIKPRIETRLPKAVKHSGTITSTFVASITLRRDILRNYVSNDKIIILIAILDYLDL